MAEPKTRGEWQDAADGAHAFLALDACRKYGLITGGPAVNVDRCLAILERAKRKGITPRPDSIERLAAELLAPDEAQRKP